MPFEDFGDPPPDVDPAVWAGYCGECQRTGVFRSGKRQSQCWRCRGKGWWNVNDLIRNNLYDWKHRNHEWAFPSIREPEWKPASEGLSPEWEIVIPAPRRNFVHVEPDPPFVDPTYNGEFGHELMRIHNWHQFIAFEAGDPDYIDA